MGATERVTWIIPRTVSDRRFRGSQGLEPFAFEGTRARSRNRDGKNVPDATKAFKTVACLNVTLAHAKIGCAIPVVGSCADCRRRVSLEAPYHGGRDAERAGVLGVHHYRRSDGQVHAADTKACGRIRLSLPSRRSISGRLLRLTRQLLALSDILQSRAISVANGTQRKSTGSHLSQRATLVTHS